MYSMLSDSNFDVLYMYTVTKVACSEREMLHVKHATVGTLCSDIGWVIYRCFLNVMRFT